jgi:hypothetical protein
MRIIDPLRRLRAFNIASQAIAFYDACVYARSALSLAVVKLIL